MDFVTHTFNSVRDLIIDIMGNDRLSIKTFTKNNRMFYLLCFLIFLLLLSSIISSLFKMDQRTVIIEKHYLHSIGS